METTDFWEVCFDIDTWEQKYQSGSTINDWYPNFTWMKVKQHILPQIETVLPTRNSDPAHHTPSPTPITLSPSSSFDSETTTESQGTTRGSTELQGTTRGSTESQGTTRGSIESQGTTRGSTELAQHEHELRRPTAPTFAELPFSPSQKKRILVVGSGKAALSREIFDEESGADIINIDISRTAVDDMNKFHSGKKYEKMKYIRMDALKMTFPDFFFDAVVDKATFDCMMCSKGRDENVPRYISEIRRVLRPGGVYINISTTRPHRCLSWFRDEEWTVNVTPVVTIKSILDDYESPNFSDASTASESDEASDDSDGKLQITRRLCYSIFVAWPLHHSR